ncbi:MAG: transposase [Deltaproteobacteria bacterium]|nr:transposase [Deltaproteobacteria bacterium]
MPKIVSHITQRVAGKELLFLEDADYLSMLATMKDIAKRRSLDIYAFCLMPNHVHILASPRAEGLDQAMRDLFSRYAMMFNRKYERKGHLFAGPYRQAVCLDDAYLLAASLYIHMNPVRGGLVGDPRYYRWSSIRLFEDRSAPRSFVRPGFVLRLLGEEDQERKKTYTELIERSLSLRAEDVLEKPDAVTRFRKALAQAFPSVFSGVGKKKHIARRTGVELIDEEELQEKIMAVKSEARHRLPETRKARRFLVEQLIARGYKRGDIAAMIGMSAKTVYNIMRGGE